MKKLLLLLSIFFSIGYSQVIRNVGFDFNEANGVIEIEYFYAPYDEEQVTDVWIEVSTNGGATFNKAKSVTGDVGVIGGKGIKKAYWSVFNDFEELDGYVVIKVAGNKTMTQGQAIASTIKKFTIGTENVWDFNESFQMYYGIIDFKFNDGGIQKVFDKKFEKKGDANSFGIKITSYPLIFDGYYFRQNLRPVGALLMPSVDAAIVGWGASVSYTILPIFKYVQPYLGLGYQNSVIYIGKSIGDALEKRNLSHLYLNYGVQISLASWLKLNYTIYNSTSSDINKDWKFSNINIAIKF